MSQRSVFVDNGNTVDIDVLTSHFTNKTPLLVSDAQKLLMLARQLFDAEPNCLTIENGISIFGPIQGIILHSNMPFHPFPFYSSSRGI